MSADLLLNKTITNLAGFLTNPANANDGNDSTYATASPGRYTTDFIIDMGEVKNNISRVRIKLTIATYLSTVLFYFCNQADGTGAYSGLTYLSDSAIGSYDEIHSAAFGNWRYFYMHCIGNYLGGPYPTINVYSIEAYSIIDKGVRVKTGSGVITLGVEPVLNSPLRFYSGGAVHSLALVDTSDPNASPVRVKLSSGVKAIMKLS